MTVPRDPDRTPPTGDPAAATPAPADPVPPADPAAPADHAPADPPAAKPAPVDPAPVDAGPPASDPAPAGSADVVPAQAAPPTTDGPAAGRPAATDDGPGKPGPEKPGPEKPGPEAAGEPPVPPWRRLSSAGALVWVLIALFGFTLVVQLRSNDTDQGLSTMRQEDLVRILSDLEARETRLNSEINSLAESQRQLSSRVQGREAALQEADRRANELGLLAGTLPARGPGLVVQIRPGGEPIKASAVLNTVQELRGAGGEVMQIAGGNGPAVRVVASTAFVDGDGGAVTVDGVRLTGPYVLTVIGAPQTMETALNIQGGVVASVGNAGGTVIAEQRKAVDVTAVRDARNLQYARPVS